MKTPKKLLRSHQKPRGILKGQCYKAKDIKVKKHVRFNPKTELCTSFFDYVPTPRKHCHPKKSFSDQDIHNAAGHPKEEKQHQQHQKQSLPPAFISALSRKLCKESSSDSKLNNRAAPEGVALTARRNRKHPRFGPGYADRPAPAHSEPMDIGPGGGECELLSRRLKRLKLSVVGGGK